MADSEEFKGQREVFMFKQESLSTSTTKSGEIPDSVTRLQLHATTSYSLTRSSTMTTQPVSDGSNRADHYTNNVTGIRFSGMIADHLNPLRFNREEKNAADYVKEINTLIDSKQLFTVVLPNIGYFENCMITSFTPTRRTQTGLGTSVNISFQRLLVGTIGTVRKVAVEDQDTLETKNSDGTIATNEIEPAVYVNLTTLNNQKKYQYMRNVEEVKRITSTILEGGG